MANEETTEGQQQQQQTPPNPPTPPNIDVVQIATQAAAQAAAQVASAQANPPTEQQQQPDPPPESGESETMTAEQIEEQINQRAAERVATLNMTRPLIDDDKFNFDQASNADLLKAALGSEYVDGMEEAEMRGFVRALASARGDADAEGNTPPSPSRSGDGRFQQTPQFYGLDPAHPDFKQRSEALQYHITEMSKSPQQHRFERRARAAGQVLERQTA